VLHQPTAVAPPALSPFGARALLGASPGPGSAIMQPPPQMSRGCRPGCSGLVCSVSEDRAWQGPSALPDARYRVETRDLVPRQEQLSLPRTCNAEQQGAASWCPAH